jgi:hypothetical protein
MNFAEKVKSALKNYKSLSSIIHRLNCWKYVTQDSQNFRLRYNESAQGIVVERRVKRNLWIIHEYINHTSIKTIGDWIR